MRILVLFAVCIAGVGCYNALHPLPPGISFEGPSREAGELRFLADLTYVDEAGSRHVEQEIFDTVVEVIRGAERFVVVDMFLYNDFQGDPPENTRALSAELTEALIGPEAGAARTRRGGDL